MSHFIYLIQNQSIEYQVRQEISPVVLTVISCLVPILQHAEVTIILRSSIIILIMFSC